MKKRSQIPEKYKWDLSTHIKDENEIKRILSIMEKLPDKLAKYNGKLNDKELLIERFNKFTKDFSEIDKLASYISNSLNVDSENIERLLWKAGQKLKTNAIDCSRLCRSLEEICDLYENCELYIADAGEGAIIKYTQPRFYTADLSEEKGVLDELSFSLI